MADGTTGHHVINRNNNHVQEMNALPLLMATFDTNRLQTAYLTTERETIAKSGLVNVNQKCSRFSCAFSPSLSLSLSHFLLLPLLLPLSFCFRSAFVRTHQGSFKWKRTKVYE